MSKVLDAVMRARLILAFLSLLLATPVAARGTLDDILPQIRAQHPGRMSDAEPWTDSEGNTHYRIKWMTPEGRIIYFNADARTGRYSGAAGDEGNDSRRGGDSQDSGRRRDDGDDGGRRNHWNGDDGDSGQRSAGQGDLRGGRDDSGGGGDWRGRHGGGDWGGRGGWRGDRNGGDNGGRHHHGDPQ